MMPSSLVQEWVVAGPPRSCEKGLKTLVLERGRNIELASLSYPTAFTEATGVQASELSTTQVRENPLISKAAGYNGIPPIFIPDRAIPTFRKNLLSGSGATIRWKS
ncbi:MAG: hypothetical protein IPO07_25100 [Haliscomenobacter sp.]|nr:hypothetical protein [Haliscomenobacter sp.]MBK9491709.1 hypothetical protein [Haliscomenobacter sp.]